MMTASTVMLGGFIAEIGRLQSRLVNTFEELRRSRERERTLAQERLVRLASHDELTGLPNRARLEERLRQLAASARRDGSRFAVVFISLDRFKDVNDAHGHISSVTVSSRTWAHACERRYDIPIRWHASAAMSS